MRSHRLVFALGVLASLAVLVTAGVVVRTAIQGDGASSGGQVLRRGELEVRVPDVADGWTTTPQATRFSYSRAASLSAPAVFRDGYCAADPDSNRGFAGLVGVTDREWLVRTWVRGLRGEQGEMTSRHDDDGAQRTDVTIDFAHPRRCGAPSAALTIVTTDDGSLILARDLGVPGALTDAAVDDIVDSLR